MARHRWDVWYGVVRPLTFAGHSACRLNFATESDETLRMSWRSGDIKGTGATTLLKDAF